MSIGATLKRDGRAQFWSSGGCRTKSLTVCTTAAGPRRTKSYATSIRGSWTASVVYTVAGPDAILFSQSSPSAGHCKYDAVKFTASCHYDTAPVVIR
jgi:hypothetical protein